MLELGIIFGAKIGYLVFYNPSSLLQNPLNIFALWQGGMSFHGGAAGVILAIIIYSLAKKISLLQLGDIICSVVPIGLFFGRVANYINSELWGKITTVSWGVVFPNAGDLPRHPSQLYEAILEGLVILLILFIMIKKNLLNYKGLISGSFLFLYGLFRVFVENFREPDLHIGSDDLYGLVSRFINEINEEKLEKISFTSALTRKVIRGKRGKHTRTVVKRTVVIFDDFQVGDYVEHSIFGTGKVQALSGRGENQRVGIEFKDGLFSGLSLVCI